MSLYIPGLFEMFLIGDPISWEVYAIAALGVVACLAVAMIGVSVIYLTRKKIRKEWGLFKAHMRYRPAPPKKTLHF